MGLGQGDSQSRAEYTTLLYNNDGKIVYKYHDDGDHDNPEKIEYAYVDGHPLGETGTDTAGTKTTKIDTGTYSLIQNLGEDTPGSAITTYTVSAGDTLQGIAAALYGNPSLWFVIAEANGLTGTESLKAGTLLKIPNNILTGRITSETHALYKESDIIGSTLPNLVAPPQDTGGGGGCGSFLMIIIVVVIAVVAAAFVGPMAGLLLQAALGTATAGVLATALAYAVAGALVYAAANIVQQGLFIALGYQDSFEWGQVGSAAVAGAFTGAAQGVAVLGQTGQITQSYAKVAAAALKVTGAAAKQIIDNGKITNWTSLAAAALGDTKTGLEGKDAVFGGLAGDIGLSSTTLEYVTPWVNLAETYVRNDGKLKPTDWAGAVGATLATAVSAKGEAAKTADPLWEATKRMGTNLLVAGALKQSTNTAVAEDYFYSSVGNEVGQLIGQSISQSLAGFLAPTRKDERAAQRAEGGDEYRSFQQDANGQLVDQYGRPAPLMLASADGGMTDVGPMWAIPGADSDASGAGQHKVQRGESFWTIASEQLGPGASDADIQRQSMALMQANPGVDPRALQLGQTLTLVGADAATAISAATLAAYGESDAQYQSYRVEQARAAEVASDTGAFGSGMMLRETGATTGPSPETRARFAWLDTQREDTRASWTSAEQNADDPFTAIGAAWARTFGQAGYDVAEGALGLYSLATDSGMRQQAMEGLTNLAKNPSILADKAAAWWNDTTFEQKAEDAGRLLFGGLATAGITKPLEHGASLLRAADEVIPDAAVANSVEGVTNAARGGTYVLRDEMGNVVRSGRTNDLARREAEHFRDPALRDYTFEPAHRTDVYAQQRGLEQLLHETYNPPLNKIRPISPQNPKLPLYRDAADDFLNGAR